MECYRRRRQTTTDARDRRPSVAPTLCIGGPVKFNVGSSVHTRAACLQLQVACEHDVTVALDDVGATSKRRRM